MGKSKKISKSKVETAPAIASKDMNSQAREEFLNLIMSDDTLNLVWKDTLKTLVSVEIPDDLSSLQRLIDGVPNVEAQTTQN
jgi:hypothetical protein